MNKKYSTDWLIAILDVLFSIIALVVLLPLCLIVATVLGFTGEKEIVYLQTRIGKNGKKLKRRKKRNRKGDTNVLNVAIDFDVVTDGFVIDI